MSKIANVFEGFNLGGFILGITLADIYAVLGIISFIISIVSGVVVIILKIKAAKADGIITKDEIKEIEHSIGDLKDKVEEFNKENK